MSEHTFDRITSKIKMFKCYHQNKILSYTFSSITPKKTAIKAIAYIFSKNPENTKINFRLININDENEYYDICGEKTNVDGISKYNLKLINTY